MMSVASVYPVRVDARLDPHLSRWRWFMKTPAAGAATTIYLASSAEVEGVTGRYFANRTPRTTNKASYDTAAVVRLWKVSADLVGLTAVPEPARIPSFERTRS